VKVQLPFCTLILENRDYNFLYFLYLPIKANSLMSKYIREIIFEIYHRIIFISLLSLSLHMTVIEDSISLELFSELREFIKKYDISSQRKQKRLEIGFDIIDYIGSKLNLNDKVRGRAASILQKLERDLFTKYSPPTEFPLICLFIVCQKNKIPICMDDLSYLANISKKRLFSDLRKLKTNYPEFNVTFVPYPFFVRRLAKVLSLSIDIQEILFDIAYDQKKKKKLHSSGKHPLGYRVRDIFNSLGSDYLTEMIDERIANGLSKRIYLDKPINREEVDILLDLERVIGNEFHTSNFTESHNVVCKIEDEHLVELRIINQTLTELPETIGKLGYIRELILSNNQLYNLPPSFSNLHDLKVLSLKNNLFITLPEFLSKLNKLSYLNMSKNQMTSLPESFGKLSRLKHLDLHSNCLMLLPETFSKLKDLQWLSLKNNKLMNLPRQFESLKKLEYIDIRKNQLNKSSLDQLRVLRENGCIINIEKSLFQTPEDKESLVNNDVEIIDDVLFKQTKKIQDFNDIEIRGLRYDGSIYVEIVNKSVKKLSLSRKQLSKISLSSIKHLKNLREFSLALNYLTDIDLSPLRFCSQLQRISINWNHLVKVDLSPLQYCPYLQRIDLNWNRLEIVDLTPLYRCSKLKVITLDDTVEILPVSDNILSLMSPVLKRICSRAK